MRVLLTGAAGQLGTLLARSAPPELELGRYPQHWRRALRAMLLDLRDSAGG